MALTIDRSKEVKASFGIAYAQYIWVIIACPLATSAALFTESLLAFFLLVIPLIVFTFLYWLFIIARAAFFRRWRRMSAITISGMLAFTVTCLIWEFQDEIHFYLARPFYEMQLRQEKNATNKWWDWTPGWGTGIGVAYIRSPEFSPPYPSENGGCTDAIKKLGGNFYLVKYSC